MTNSDTDSKVSSKNITQLVAHQKTITIKASGYRNDEHDFTMKALLNCPGDNENPNLKKIIYEFKSIPAWKRGQVILIQKEDLKVALGKQCYL